MSSTFTTEFRQEFQAERERWLRKRVLWYLGSAVAFRAVILIPTAFAFLAVTNRAENAFVVISLVAGVLALILYVGALLHARKRLFTHKEMVTFVVRLFVLSGALAIASSVLAFELSEAAAVAQREETAKESAPPPAAPTAAAPAEPGESPAASSPEDAQPQPAAAPAKKPHKNVRVERISKDKLAVSGVFAILVGHLILCAFLPLTPRECFRPIIPLIALNAVVAVVYYPGPAWFIFSILLSAVVGIPGALICMWRDNRFRSSFQLGALKRRYGEMRQELTDARRIHEALFPKPATDGPVRMDYRYEPMRQIGGDYLYTRFTPSPAGPLPALHVVIIDVTGHGIPAALTVNRLHGEIERLFAEHPQATPGLLLQLLNRYVHLTLATHSVYVTAICIRVDPNPATDPGAAASVGSLDWASGGHPPAFIRCVDGTIHRLDSTTFVLGACHGDDFIHHQQTIPFGPGDVCIAYTDGATEARDRTGRMLRIDGFQRIIAGVTPENGSLSQAILRAVEQFRFGPPADDTLVVEVSRPVS